MKGRRVILAWGVVPIILGTAVAGGYYMITRLPPPAACSKEQLLRWLVLRDLSTTSPRTRSALVDRLQTEILRDPNVTEDASSLTLSQSRQLHKNVKLLQHVWFVDRVDQYHQLPAAQRGPFLDRQINTLMRWPNLNQLEPAAKTRSPHNETSGNSASRFFAQIDVWMDQARSSQQSKMQAAVHAALRHWLITFDLNNTAVETRRDLARRLAVELRDGLSTSAAAAGLIESQRQQLRNNASLLLEAWFHDRVDEFSVLTESNRQAYVEEQIDEIMRWGIGELFSNNSSQSHTTPLDTLAPLIPLVMEWIDRAPPEKRPSMREMIIQLQQIVLRRARQNGRQN